ncbi:MAG: helix-turn-helix transcriptional regulator, partial [Oscillospiraceae bacterium]|nr:helix-turn-helix transcriptional regulator [Oscillospiraceae bacterium]
ILRRESGLSQSQLAAESGISVRTIQNYEQRVKDINKAQADNLMMIAYVLNCSMEDLMERI